MILTFKKKYRLFLEGGNVWLNTSNPTLLGFYTTRFVTARDSQTASGLALQLVRDELDALGILNSHEDPPNVVVLETVELKSFGSEGVPGKGFTFFPDDCRELS
jgi:hypothetical protein